MTTNAPGSAALALLWVASATTKPPTDATTALPMTWRYVGTIICPTLTVNTRRASFNIEFAEPHPNVSELKDGSVVLDIVDGLLRHRRWFATVVFNNRQMRQGDFGPTYDAVLYPSRTNELWSALLEPVTND